MDKIDPNARVGLEEFKAEMSKELGLDTTLDKSVDNTKNIFYAGKVGGLMTRKLVEMGEENLINKD
ncbi:MAG: alpha/beta-type small acid-soluble spore protein [Clostridiaceae bacterium]|nr:alpha/beta-type small acid-soluble spore protein [Clostridiaceae bacterium]MBW4858899.1 alpha/beta-type small acid-soluble spore protein [Clostridiaceae bacterium]MBW4869474.1 alpha/beta-type small acid-soluble spore protein [Clostridiaceae bacterium]